MPYIPQTSRIQLDTEIAHIESVATVGELNYVITELCCTFLRDKGVNYENINAVMGVLACAGQELYRRVAVPYEEQKREDNGDVVGFGDCLRQFWRPSKKS